MAASENSIDAKDALGMASRGLKSSLEISERTVLSIGSLEDRSEIMEGGINRNLIVGPKPLSESKCISNLKVLGSDKSEVKQ